jgi:hypothetical protein
MTTALRDNRDMKTALYAASLPERTLRSVSSLTGGMLRELSDLALPEKVRDAALYRVTAGIFLRFLIEQLGGVRGVYSPADPIAHKLVPRYAVGGSIEMAGFLTFSLSPVWVLAALGDATRVGKTLFIEVGNALKAEGLLDASAHPEDIGQLLDGLEETSTHLALTINMPPLNVRGLRREWDQFRANLAKLRGNQLPKDSEVHSAWSNIRSISNQAKRPVFRVSTAMALSALSAVPPSAQWLSRSAVTAARAAGTVVGRPFLNHYAAASKEIASAGFPNYWTRHSRRYLVTAVRHFLPEQRSWTERALIGSE